MTTVEGDAAFMANGFPIAVLSHKGGAGRTTMAAALAWCWGRAGVPVGLIDADPAQNLAMLALGPNGDCLWWNVLFREAWPAEGDEVFSRRFVLVDCPPLAEPAAKDILDRVHGVVLVCPADPLALRTIPVTAAVLRAARPRNPRVELLGVAVGVYNAEDPTQAETLARLRKIHGDLLLGPPIPYDPALRDWPADPGADLPEGPGRQAYEALARAVEQQADRTTAAG